MSGLTEILLNIPYLNLIIVKFIRIPYTLSETTKIYACVSLVLLVFSVPLLLLTREIRKNSMKILLLGLVNLFLLLSLASVVFDGLAVFKSIKVYVIIFYLIELGSVLIISRLKKIPDMGVKKLTNINIRKFIIVLALHFILFIVLMSNFIDLKEHKLFNPGYQMNHDSMRILSSIKIKQDKLLTQHNYGFTTGKEIIDRYPMGGSTYILFFSDILNMDPYVIYQSVLVYTYLLVIFAVFYFLEKVGANIFISSLVALMACFNYLSVGIINMSVLASSIVIPILLLFIFDVQFAFKKPKVDLTTFLYFTALLYVSIYVYSYYPLFYIPFVLLLSAMLYRSKTVFFRLCLVLLTAVFISFLVPSVRYGFVEAIRSNFFSPVKEVNIFANMLGNTIGFINPLAALSLWYYNPDYRFALGTVDNYWLAFFLLFPLFLFVTDNNKDKDAYVKKMLVSISLTMLSLIFFTYFISKSPYQNVKALHNFAVAWPIIIYMVLHNAFISKLKWIRYITIFYFIVFFVFSMRSSILSYAYVGKPFVGSNYELKNAENFICNNNKTKVYIGRDEWSVYFLNSCNNLTYLYDRMADLTNAMVFFKLNAVNTLNTDCDKGLFKNPPGVKLQNYQVVVVDKCFEFNTNGYRLVRDLKYHRIYERID